MNILKKAFYDYVAMIKEYGVIILLILVVANLVIKFGIGFLLALGLIGFAGHAVYNKLMK